MTPAASNPTPSAAALRAATLIHPLGVSPLGISQIAAIIDREMTLPAEAAKAVAPVVKPAPPVGEVADRKCQCFGHSGLHASTHVVDDVTRCDLCGWPIAEGSTDVLTAINGGPPPVEAVRSLIADRDRLLADNKRLRAALERIAAGAPAHPPVANYDTLGDADRHGQALMHWELARIARAALAADGPAAPVKAEPGDLATRILLVCAMVERGSPPTELELARIIFALEPDAEQTRLVAAALRELVLNELILDSRPRLVMSPARAAPAATDAAAALFGQLVAVAARCDPVAKAAMHRAANAVTALGALLIAVNNDALDSLDDELRVAAIARLAQAWGAAEEALGIGAPAAADAGEPASRAL